MTHLTMSPTGPTLPSWVPQDALRYLQHTEGGCSLRMLAQRAGQHASTVLRQVRRIEARRDDPLIDRALDRLGDTHFSALPQTAKTGTPKAMNVSLRKTCAAPSDSLVEQEARRILRRLSEPGACLAVARDMEKAVVVRDTGGGNTVRTAVVDRPVAEAMALKDWISCPAPDRISKYRITVSGRAALKRILSTDDRSPFAGQHTELEDRDVHDETGRGAKRRVRYNLAESPLVALSRRKDKDGRAFLTPDMVAAGERLREDFELAQMGPRVAQNWDRFLTGGDRGAFAGDGGLAEGPKAARDRVLAALGDLGPGLGDVILRSCCFLEGMEALERRMGWSARSGKIVLRIALQRLCRHYDERAEGWSPLIG